MVVAGAAGNAPSMVSLSAYNFNPQGRLAA
jgi:hypothetical protein